MIVPDSHIGFGWCNLEFRRIPAAVAEAIDKADRVGVFPVSCCELALAYRKGRLELPIPPSEWFHFALAESHIDLLPFNERIASRAVDLGNVHRDPFDRIIIAAALCLDAQPAGVDGRFPEYPELSGRLLA